MHIKIGGTVLEEYENKHRDHDIFIYYIDESRAYVDIIYNIYLFIYIYGSQAKNKKK